MTCYDLENKTALITGANRGIGAAYVAELARSGAKKIYAGARDLKNLKPLLQRYQNLIEPLQLDVTNAEEIAAVSEKISALDILINNAGIVSASTAAGDTALDTARREMETNFFGPMQLTLALLPQLKQSEQPAIINVSSIAGISNFPSIAPYSVSKAALHSYTQGLRAELAAQQFRILGVYPGPVDTRMTDGWDTEKASAEEVAKKTLEALIAGETDVFPDPFSQQMYAVFLQNPPELEKTFAAML